MTDLNKCVRCDEHDDTLDAEGVCSICREEESSQDALRDAELTASLPDYDGLTNDDIIHEEPDEESLRMEEEYLAARDKWNREHGII